MKAKAITVTLLLTPFITVAAFALIEIIAALVDGLRG